MAVKSKYFSIMSAAVIAAATLGAGSVYAQSSNMGSGAHGKSMGEAGADTMNAAGKTEANREGRMSPMGQNATSSVAPRTGVPGGK